MKMTKRNPNTETAGSSGAANMLGDEANVDAFLNKERVPITATPAVHAVQPLPGKVEDEPGLFTIERTGEPIQKCLVEIANSLGDCDDAADLAEVVSVLDTLERQQAVLLRQRTELLEALERLLSCCDGEEPALISESAQVQARAAIAKAHGGKA